jgi:hypothetical protein
MCKGSDEMPKEKLKVSLPNPAVKCPICDKIFYPMPEHQYKIGSGSKHDKLVCTYHCMRKYEKQHHMKRRGESNER